MCELNEIKLNDEQKKEGVGVGRRTAGSFHGLGYVGFITTQRTIFGDLA